MRDRSIEETLPLAGTEAPRAPLGAIVRGLDAPTSPPRFRLEGDVPCRIGSAADCDVVIERPTISRAHVELTLVEDGVQVRDLGSRNGTFYLGQRIESMVVGLGATLQLGDVHIVLDADTDALAHQRPFEGDEYRGVIGRSSAMRRLFAVLLRLEGSLTTVLLEGESGVGKEVVARAIHEGSSVAQGPLIVLNCGALPRDLIGSELFGHKKGAFTGAVEARRGAFESADGGTLFLDEIGELPLDLQPMLLRALETGDVRPIGGDTSKRVKVRVVAATNRNLENEVHAGKFREDLFYRLAVVRLRIATLRERLDDIPELASSFARDAGHDGPLPAPVIEQLKARAWPGNARELRNTVHAYVALGVLPEATRSRSATLDLALREMVDPGVPYADQKDQLVDRFTAAYLEVLLGQTGGNQTVAARLAGLDRGYLGRLIAKYNIVQDGNFHAKGRDKRR